MQQRRTAAEAVWLALAHLHRMHPSREAFPAPDVLRVCEQLGLWRMRPETLLQHLRQWVNAQSESPSARAAYVTSLGRGGPYRLVKPGDPVAPNRARLPRHPNPGTDPGQQEMVRWYTESYAKAPPAAPQEVEQIEVERMTAHAVRSYAAQTGADPAAVATALLQEGLRLHKKKDAILDVIGIAAGRPTGAVDHDAGLYD